MNRRTFLGTTAAALASGRRSLAASAEPQTPKENRGTCSSTNSPGAFRTICLMGSIPFARHNKKN
jgi:hypothetical protein